MEVYFGNFYPGMELNERDIPSYIDWLETENPNDPEVLAYRQKQLAEAGKVEQEETQQVADGVELPDGLERSDKQWCDEMVELAEKGVPESNDPDLTKEDELAAKEMLEMVEGRRK